MPDMIKILEDAPKNDVIQKALMTAHAKLEEYDRVMCSVSGGSDSDIMMDILERVKPDGKEIIYVWFDTGMEYEATKRHLPELEQKYGVEIHKEKAGIPVAAGCRKYGIPFLSKQVSQRIESLQKRCFSFAYRSVGLATKGMVGAVAWWENTRRKGSKFNINKHKLLKEFMIYNPPMFRVSDKCCKGAKKDTARAANKKYKPDMVAKGMRRAENGVRSSAYTNCFTKETDKTLAEYRPIFFFSDKDKLEYKTHYGIRYSDCYEIWGMKRTGCAGCPFGSRFEEELKLMQKYEPKLYKAANAVFGESYAYTRAYRKFKKRYMGTQDGKACMQLGFDDLEGEKE